MALFLFLVGAFLLSITYLMVDLYSKRYILQTIFFHIGIGCLLFSAAVCTTKVFNFSSDSSSKVLLLIFSTLACLFLLEFGIRLNGAFYTSLEKCSNGAYHSFLRQEQRDSWYWVRPPDTTLNFLREEFKFERTTNSLGLSEREFATKKSGLRIIGLGDSFTEGTGVSQDSTWLKRVESQLRKISPELRAETMNAGIGGSDPVYEYQLLADLLLEFKPDIVIMSINSSDLSEIGYRGGFERFNEDGSSGKAAPKWEWIYQQSHIVRMVVHNGFGMNHYLCTEEEASAGKDAAVDHIKEAVERLVQLGAANQFKTLVVLHPIEVDFGNEGYVNHQLVELQDYLSSSTVNDLDILQCFNSLGIKNKEQAKDYYWPLDQHFNQKGYDIYGDCVSNALVEMIKEEPSFFNLDSISN